MLVSVYSGICVYLSLLHLSNHGSSGALHLICVMFLCRRGFGENEIFGTFQKRDPLETGSMHSSLDPLKRSIHASQKFLQKQMTFSLPILTSFFPRRQKVSVVVGQPIRFKETDTLDDAVVDKNHMLYLTSLRKLYEEYKGQYGDKDVELRIL